MKLVEHCLLNRSRREPMSFKGVNRRKLAISEHPNVMNQAALGQVVLLGDIKLQVKRSAVITNLDPFSFSTARRSDHVIAMKSRGPYSNDRSLESGDDELCSVLLKSLLTRKSTLQSDEPEKSNFLDPSHSIPR